MATMVSYRNLSGSVSSLPALTLGMTESGVLLAFDKDGEVVGHIICDGWEIEVDRDEMVHTNFGSDHMVQIVPGPTRYRLEVTTSQFMQKSEVPSAPAPEPKREATPRKVVRSGESVLDRLPEPPWVV